MDFNFTATVEKEFDEIAQGLKEWTKMLRDFYDPFHKEVEYTLENAERASHERELGVDPESGKKVLVRVGRFGPLVQIGAQDDEEKPRFASLRAGQMIETITFEEAMDLFKLPKKVGLFEDIDMFVAIGRFGPYIRHDGAFYSLPKGMDPFDVEEEMAIEIIKTKRQKDIDKIIRTFDENPDARIEEGRWGPFIRFGKQNVKIPKGTNHEDLTYEAIVTLAENDPKFKKAPAKKTAAKKAPAKKAAAKKTTTKAKAAPAKASTAKKATK